MTIFHALESCSLNWLTGKRNTTSTTKSVNITHIKLRNVNNDPRVHDHQNISRIMKVETAHDKTQNQTEPRKSSRWDQYHRFPQTIEAAPGKIHHMIEATKKLLDPFQIAKVVMESVPDVIRESVWYVIIGMASAWAIFIFVIFMCATGKVMTCAHCLAKNTRRGINALEGRLKKSRHQAGKQNTEHELIRSRP